MSEAKKRDRCASVDLAPSWWRTARGSCRGGRRPPRRRARGARAAAGSPARGPGPSAGTPPPVPESPPKYRHIIIRLTIWYLIVLSLDSTLSIGLSIVKLQ